MENALTRSLLRRPTVSSQLTIIQLDITGKIPYKVKKNAHAYALVSGVARLLHEIGMPAGFIGHCFAKKPRNELIRIMAEHVF